MLTGENLRNSHQLTSYGQIWFTSTWNAPSKCHHWFELWTKTDSKHACCMMHWHVDTKLEQIHSRNTPKREEKCNLCIHLWFSITQSSILRLCAGEWEMKKLIFHSFPYDWMLFIRQNRRTIFIFPFLFLVHHSSRKKECIRILYLFRVQATSMQCVHCFVLVFCLHLRVSVWSEYPSRVRYNNLLDIFQLIYRWIFSNVHYFWLHSKFWNIQIISIDFITSNQTLLFLHFNECSISMMYVFTCDCNAAFQKYHSES